MTASERTKLLFGPYQAPRLKRGDVAFCLVRDYPVVMVGMSAARIPWPRCRPLNPPRVGTGLLVDDELARAVCNESCTAVSYWWGVHQTTVIRWRKALRVDRKNNPGTHRLVLSAIAAALDSCFGPDARPGPVRTRRGRAAVWTAEEVALLGALTDAQVARTTGRSMEAVGKKRLALGRAPVARGADGLRGYVWTAEEDEALRTLSAAEVSRRFHRSLRAIDNRRRALGISAKREPRGPESVSGAPHGARKNRRVVSNG